MMNIKSVCISKKELAELESSKRLSDAIITLALNGGFESYCIGKNGRDLHILKTDNGIMTQNESFTAGFILAADKVKEQSNE